MKLVIPVPADVLAPKGARPSAGTVLTGDIFSQILLRILNTFSLITGCYSMKSRKVSWHRVNKDDDLRFYPHGNIMIHHTVSLYVIHVIRYQQRLEERHIMSFLRNGDITLQWRQKDISNESQENAICMSPGGHCWDYYPGTQWVSQNILQFI